MSDYTFSDAEKILEDIDSLEKAELLIRVFSRGSIAAEIEGNLDEAEVLMYIADAIYEEWPEAWEVERPLLPQYEDD